MNVLVLNWRDIKHPRAGGAEVRFHRIYEDIARAGHKVVLIASRFAGAPDSEVLGGIEVHRVGSDATYAALCLRHLPEWEKRFNIDMVVEDFNKLPLLSPWRTRKPLLIQMHHLWKGSIFHEDSFFTALIVWLGEQTLRIVYRKERFCVVSDSTRNELHGMGIPLDRIAIIHNGVDLAFYQPPPDPAREQSVLWLGRIQKYKGVLDVCRAFQKIAAKYPRLTLRIAGTGPYKHKVEAWVRKAGLSGRILFPGFVSEEEKRTLLQRSLFLVQSSYKEGWGLTVIEANACGTPVIANNAPGLRDSVRDGVSGLLYQFRSVDSLAEKMQQLMDDAPLYSELCGKVRGWAEQFKWDTAGQETLALLQDVYQRRLQRNG
ncbi:MAG: glycosyltransferase family 4 protein [bacterium]